ncbi:MAG: hypothetical protein U0R66_02880 [Mycobacterium sp.]
MKKALLRLLDRCATVDPAVALGLFGTGVGMALPVPISEVDVARTPANRVFAAQGALQCGM